MTTNHEPTHSPAPWPDAPIQKKLAQAIYSNRLEVIQEAIALGADIRLPSLDQRHLAPIHRAAMLETRQALDLLVAAGLGQGDLEAIDSAGQTPLMLACFDNIDKIIDNSPASRSQLPAAALLSLGANPNARDNDGDTPLHRAASSGCMAIIEMLLAAGADPRILNLHGHKPIDEVRQRNRGGDEAMASGILQAATDALELREALPCAATRPASAPPRI